MSIIPIYDEDNFETPFKMKFFGDYQFKVDSAFVECFCDIYDGHI